jgi:hypothetical protein
VNRDKGNTGFSRGCVQCRTDLVPASTENADTDLPSSWILTMAKCEVCGNDYYLSFEVIAAGARHTFDSFECAIHKLAPVCDHCGCKIIGHGIEAQGTFYCCANCARQAGVQEVKDHV